MWKIEKLSRLCIVLLSFVVLSYFFREIRSLAIPVVIGCILGFVFAPIIPVLQRWNIPTSIAIVFICILFILISGMLLGILYGSISSVSDRFGFYQDRVTDIITKAQEKIVPFNESLVLQFRDGIVSFLTNSILSISRGFVSLGSSYIIVLFTMVFILLERRWVSHKVKELSPQEQSGHRFESILLTINNQISRFIALKSIISLFTALIVYVVFSFIGLDFAFLWAVLTFLFNFIPSVGSVIITLASIFFSIIQFFPDWNPVIIVVVVTVSTQMLIGNIIDPMVMGDTLNLSSLVIWLSLLYWGWTWGPIGMLLAVPITVSIRIVCENISLLHPISVMMGNGGMIHRRSKRKHKLH